MNHIDVVEVTNPNGYIVQELTIDGASLGQWLDKHTEGSEDEHIAAFIRPFSELLFAWSHDIDWKGDRRFVRTLIDMDSAPVPILLCEDDPDFSCIVIVADVEKTEELLCNSDDELNGAECAKILEEILPMGEEALQKQLDEYGEILFDPCICDVIASPLNDLVRRKEPDKILLETYLNALKILKKHGDIHVRNNLEISILDDFDEERAAFRKYGLKCDEL